MTLAGKTIIVIAHRIKTVQKCDQIFFIDKKVALFDKGTYHELSEKNEHFKKFSQKHLNIVVANRCKPYFYFNLSNKLKGLASYILLHLKYLMSCQTCLQYKSINLKRYSQKLDFKKESK